MSPSLPGSECSGDGQGMSSVSAALAPNPQKPNWTSPESGTSVGSKPAGDPVAPLGGLVTSSSLLCSGSSSSAASGSGTAPEAATDAAGECVKGLHELGPGPWVQAQHPPSLPACDPSPC